MTDGTYVAFKFKGTEYNIQNSDVTNQRLKQLKAYFGLDYGSFHGFPRLLLQFDVDAWAGMIWIAQQVSSASGDPAKRVQVEDPRKMEFSLDDIELLVDDPDAVAEPAGDDTDPLEHESIVESPVSTDDSPATASTNSEPNTESGSPTSSE